ncbi:OsmC family protein [Streptomyces coeruleoprunus]|uniref:OsmC family protein n=1 Tax=Streptomyces coeruleoprunus TaxID=285563 RepID=A0ABV9XHM5_9ACTN
MATKRHAHTVWEGNLTEGRGTVTLDYSGLGSYEVSWPARAEEARGKTSPEELIAAAHSSCFSMAFSAALGKNGGTPTRLNTKAEVTFVPGTGITNVHLTVEGEVPGMDEVTFAKIAEDAKANCPVSKALAGTEITLTASLVS